MSIILTQENLFLYNFYVFLAPSCLKLQERKLRENVILLICNLRDKKA